jgi:hypothetical protein
MSQKSLLEQWREHPTRRKELAELMREPAFGDALAIIKEGLYTLKSPPTGGGQYSLLDYYALYGAKQAGYIEALRSLLSLAELTLSRTPDRKPWDTVDKDHHIQQMAREQGITEEELKSNA